ncbi:DUF4395 domain-containing protein [Planococcus sp. APC 4015]|nr:DUF4395 domain-containing protein [Planococcus sp. APC 4015]
MSETRPRGIDPRGPRFAAGITSLLLLAVVFVGLVVSPLRTTAFGWFAYQPLPDQTSSLEASLVWFRLTDPAFLLLLVVALLFLWAVVWPRTAPWGVLFRRVVQPRLTPAVDLEDPRPPRFAQGVGLFVVTIGIVLHIVGVAGAVVVAAAVAFVAAFLNAAFGVCLGCMMYLLLQRAGILGRARPTTA